MLLDLGCGTGAAVRDAAHNVRRAVGFDLSPGMIAQARARADGLVGNVEFVVGDVSGALPFEAGAFTAIVCTTALHHFPRPRDTVAEAARVLGPRGRLVIADANRRHPAVFVFDLVLRAVQRSHVGFRSPMQLMHDLSAAGFDHVSYVTVHWRSYAFVAREASALSARELERLTAPGLRRVIEEGARTAIVTLGSIEYQGRHLPLGADALLADRVGQEVAERLDAVLAPTVRIGFAPQHDEFAGTSPCPPGR